ncbi:helix-turn-helix domain-containing protein [Paenibacillus tarimensis]
MEQTQIRYVMTPLTDPSYPLFMETVGLNPEQEDIARDDGYPYFHWIQTKEGKGELEINGSVFLLSEGTGALLFPHTPHRYKAVVSRWSTVYLTFGGSLAQEILQLLGQIDQSSFFSWERSTPLSGIVESILHSIRNESRPAPLNASLDIYRFVTELRKHGQLNKRSSISHMMETLDPLLEWLEKHYSDASIGLKEMASILGVTPRHMNTLFQEVFSLSPYAYLILHRIRKAKMLLLQELALPVKEVSQRVGFRDASHFVASFRKHVGVTPETFRTYR